MNEIHNSYKKKLNYLEVLFWPIIVIMLIIISFSAWFLYFWWICLFAIDKVKLHCKIIQLTNSNMGLKHSKSCNETA